VRLLTAPTEDIGKLMSCLHGLSTEGAPSFLAGIKTAMVSARARGDWFGGEVVARARVPPMHAAPVLLSLAAGLPVNRL
jgi:hypothetical protein